MSLPYGMAEADTTGSVRFVPRRESHCRQRLQEAALSLYAELGYANTTVAEVAVRAGVTERTYFRYFADKREVVFADSGALLGIVLEAVRSAPQTAPVWELIRLALQALAADLEPRQERLRVRAQVIASTPELLERDLAKQASWVGTLHGAIQARGTDPPQAALAAAVAGAVFHVAYNAWLTEPDGRDLCGRLNETVVDTKHLVNSS